MAAQFERGLHEHLRGWLRVNHHLRSKWQNTKVVTRMSFVSCYADSRVFSLPHFMPLKCNGDRAEPWVDSRTLSCSRPYHGTLDLGINRHQISGELELPTFEVCSIRSFFNTSSLNERHLLHQD